MSDLISRSALMEEIKSLQVSVTGLRAGKGILNEYAKQYRESVLRTIVEQPIAYDVKNIVNAFGEKIKSVITIEYAADDLLNESIRTLIINCISDLEEIVKAGG